MTSEDLRRFELCEWWPFHADASWFQGAPMLPGVYVLRFARGNRQHPVGHSDIAYVGCSPTGLRARLKSYQRAAKADPWLMADSSNTTNRIGMAMSDSRVGQLQVAWNATASPRGARDLEAEILHDFELDHLGVPLLTRRPGRSPETDRNRISTRAGTAWTDDTGVSVRVYASASADDLLVDLFHAPTVDGGERFSSPQNGLGGESIQDVVGVLMRRLEAATQSFRKS